MICLGAIGIGPAPMDGDVEGMEASGAAEEEEMDEDEGCTETEAF